LPKGNRQQATGNRQQATGNRQQATGNYTHPLNNRVNYLTVYFFNLIVSLIFGYKAGITAFYYTLSFDR